MKALVGVARVNRVCGWFEDISVGVRGVKDEVPRWLRHRRNAGAGSNKGDGTLEAQQKGEACGGGALVG